MIRASSRVSLGQKVTGVLFELGKRGQGMVEKEETLRRGLGLASDLLYKGYLSKEREHTEYLLTRKQIVTDASICRWLMSDVRS